MMKLACFLSLSLVLSSCQPTESKISYKNERDQQSPADNKATGEAVGANQQQASGPIPQELYLTWDAPAAEENVTSFKFYASQSVDGEYALFHEASAETVAGLAEGLPELTVDVTGNTVLEQLEIDTMCFYMTAINTAGESDGSGKLCFQ